MWLCTKQCTLCTDEANMTVRSCQLNYYLIWYGCDTVCVEIQRVTCEFEILKCCVTRWLLIKAKNVRHCSWPTPSHTVSEARRHPLQKFQMTGKSAKCQMSKKYMSRVTSTSPPYYFLFRWKSCRGAGRRAAILHYDSSLNETAVLILHGSHHF